MQTGSVGGGDGGAVVELAAIDAAVRPIATADYPTAAKRPAYSVLDTSRYETLTGRTIRHFTSPLAEYLLRRRRPEA